jgi:hypothetical protein
MKIRKFNESAGFYRLLSFGLGEYLQHYIADNKDWFKKKYNKTYQELTMEELSELFDIVVESDRKKIDEILLIRKKHFSKT